MGRQTSLWAALLLGAVLLSGWIAYKSTTGAEERALADAQTLLLAADKLYSSPYEIHMQHSGPFRTAADDAVFAQLGEEAAAAFGLASAQPSRDAHGVRTFAASNRLLDVDAGRTELALSGWPDGTTVLTLRWTAREGAGSGDVLEWAEKAADRFAKLGLRPEWTMTMAGQMGSLSADEVQTLKRKLTSALKAVPLETYADAGSEIVSYISSALSPVGRHSGGQANLQTALHRDSIYGTYRLTIGSPLIGSGL